MTDQIVKLIPKIMCLNIIKKAVNTFIEICNVLFRLNNSSVSRECDSKSPTLKHCDIVSVQRIQAYISTCI